MSDKKAPHSVQCEQIKRHSNTDIPRKGYINPTQSKRNHRPVSAASQVGQTHQTHQAGRRDPCLAGDRKDREFLVYKGRDVRVETG